jgi:Zn-dependent protease/CBS domain-containing protein
MKWSLKLGEIAGIGIYVHWTFALLLLWLVYGHMEVGNSTALMLEGIGFVLAIFGCIVLHELGHALTARRYGISTRDITLLPIGGVARLERMPDDPRQELWVALAGPAVNVAIAAVLFIVLMVMGRLESIQDVEYVGGPFLEKLMVVNLFLVAFNMLPAFPMDGGRVLRALLAMRMPRVKATHWAANIGQAVAILFGVVGLMTGQFMLMFIALFVYLGAQGEAHSVEMRSIFSGISVHDAMVRRFRTLDPHDSLVRAKEELLAGSQQDFPVVQEGQLAGMLERGDLIKALAQPEMREVQQVMRTDCPAVREGDPLDRVVAAMQAVGCATVPVVNIKGELVGLLTSENVGEWAMIQAALRDRTARVGNSQGQV